MKSYPMSEASAIDAGVAWHYGDPFAEQRLLASGRGVVDLSHRGVLQVTGVDRLTWLDSLTSQLLLGLQPGDSTYDLLLDPNGRIESEMHIAVLDDRLLLGLEPGNAEHVLAFLDRMRFMLRVEVADVSAAWGTVWEPSREPHALHPSVLTPAVFAGLPMGDVGADVSRYRAAAESSFAGRDVFVPRAALPEYLLAAGELAGTWAWNALRIAAGVPRFGVESDDKSIPHELGLLGVAVHMRKGCYRGQETVARTFNMGKPPRRLVLLHLDGSLDEPPQHGADVMLGERRVGFIGMGAQHHELGPIASAVIKRNTDVDAVLEIAGVRATQQVVVNA
jgi:folate-binding protein YgfZ